MHLATPQFAQEIATLMLRLNALSNIGQDEIDASKRFNALPINADFFYYLVRPDGTVIMYEPPQAPEYKSNSVDLLMAIVYASCRFPSLAQFIPLRPEGSSDCEFCAGSGIRRDLGLDTQFKCPVCLGLCWDLQNLLGK